jgi:hypothetical protein
MTTKEDIIRLLEETYDKPFKVYFNSRHIDHSYFSKFIEKIKIDENGCWLWQGWFHSKGYGGFAEGKHNFRAHRWSYEYFRGEIPDGLVIDHLCRVRACCNPDHLEAVTQRTNSLRGEQNTMQSAVLGLCKKGHQLSIRKKRSKDSGFRWCPTCDAERAKKYREIRRLEKRTLETI